MKVVLVSVDGMRPDSLTGIPAAQKFAARSSFSMRARSVMPSVTLPCHMSMFHSVKPERHGITTNTYIPQVRPINGLCEQLNMAQKSCAFFYDWEPLRDLSRPGSLSYACYHSQYTEGLHEACINLTKDFAAYYPRYLPDFSFIYFGMTDEVGHDHGWMGAEYLDAMKKSWDEIDKLLSVLEDAGEEFTMIVTADHGGHDRHHGTELPEDMTIPLLILGPDFEPGRELDDTGLLDIAPTVVSLLGAASAREWEGRALNG